MATVRLPSTLRPRAGGRADVAAPGATVGEVLRGVERACPGLAGWILDETGALRRHLTVFVGDERVTTADAVTEGETMTVVQAISGGAPDEVEILAGTRKGLFVLRGKRGGDVEIASRAFQGNEVDYAVRDPRTGRYFASVTSAFYGPKLFFTDDLAAEWKQAEGIALPEDAGVSAERIWTVHPGEEDGVLWAGIAPAALFRSDDDGETWTLNRGLWDQPSREKWQPGAGGMCLHSICPWPGDPATLSVAISAAGVWHSQDGGETWEWSVEGIVPRYLPEEARATAMDYCVHNLHRSPVQPERMYLQFHWGVYRSDDRGRTWTDIGGDGKLPSDFGFPMVVDPRDPDRAYVIPLKADGDRVTPDGRLRVYETRDAGAAWEARTEGLPQKDAYLTILRQAFAHDGGEPLGLYFGATSGALYGSADGGASWRAIAPYLPPILSVRCG